MRHKLGFKAGGVVLLLSVSLVVPSGFASDTPQEVVARYILATVKAFRTVYAKDIVDAAARAGVKPMENWKENKHGIMLPIQFVKAAGAEIKDFELGLIALTPIYKSNLPKTQGETDALKKITANPSQEFITFVDGNQFKGVTADLAIAQSCVDCHNNHPSSPKKDFKKGDPMGAIILKLRK